MVTLVVEDMLVVMQTSRSANAPLCCAEVLVYLQSFCGDTTHIHYAARLSAGVGLRRRYAVCVFCV